MWEALVDEEDAVEGVDEVSEELIRGLFKGRVEEGERVRMGGGGALGGCEGVGDEGGHFGGRKRGPVCARHVGKRVRTGAGVARRGTRRG